MLHQYIYCKTSSTCADQNSSCTHGFLNDKTLEIIINSSLLQYNQLPMFERSNETGLMFIVTNMTLTAPGLLTKWTFATKYNHNVKAENWPELQIWKKYKNDETRYTKVAGTSMKPRRTGYLNVFEYDLSYDPIKVESGVYQPGADAQYSLQFLVANEGGVVAPINYVYITSNSLLLENIDITERHEERSLVPLVFAEIKGTKI